MVSLELTLGASDCSNVRKMGENHVEVSKNRGGPPKSSI